MQCKEKIKNLKPYFKSLDLIRLLACIAVLLYHLGLLKGGYLAVCIFFVLSGYLSCVSAFNDERFSFKKYYLKKIKKLYIPLIFVVFITIFVVSFLPNIGWYNLKPETTSILFCYNNFWQLGANMNYFASHSNSPFIHLWYIAILLQFDLVFPFLYVGLKKIGDKTKKIIPCLIIVFLSMISSLVFIYASMNKSMMVTYYSTFTRVYSLLFGMSWGFIHHYYGQVLTNKMKNNKISKLIFNIYLLILVGLFIFSDANSIYFSGIMILVTLITCRLIDYSTIEKFENLTKKDKIIKLLSEIIYEVYLIQYPVIFVFQYCNISNTLKLLLTLFITIVLSYIFHFAIDIKKDRYKWLRYCILIFVIMISLCGLYKYVEAEDYTIEMKELEIQLAENAKKLEENQENYTALIKEEEENWNKILKNLEDGENNIKELVIDLPVLGIGDSVMLGAIDNLHNTFPNSYIDAEVSRSLWKASDILEELSKNGELGEPIVINLGANGDCSLACKKQIMEKCGDKQVFWLNTTNNLTFNESLLSFSKDYSNLHVIDWNALSKGHSEYFYADGIHLTASGRKAYASIIYDAIYQNYLNGYNIKKQEIINKHECELKNKISFYGNGILLNAYDYLRINYEESNFVIKHSFTFETLKEQLIKAELDNTLSYKILFAFDSDIDLSIADYQELIEICNDHKIYILSLNKNLNELNTSNVYVIDFYSELKENEDYLFVDKKHLTEKGNKAMLKIINDNL